LQLPKLHPKQLLIHNNMARFNILCCGRRFGKDVFSINEMILPALEGFPVAWFAPTYKNLTEVWRTIRDLLAPVIRDKSENEHRLELVSGGVVDMWSLDQSGVARGRAYRRVVINEAAQVSTLQQSWEEVIRATLADYKGDALFPSTPKGFNFYKVLFDRGEDPMETDYASWQFTSYDNPYIDPAEIDAAKAELPESVFAQEFMAQFVQDATGVFRNLRAAAVLDEQPPEPKHHYVVGCDWGKMNDFSVFSVMDLKTHQQVYLDRSNHLDYMVQIQRLRVICKRYKVSAIIAEHNSMGQAILEWLRRMKLPVYAWTATNVTKSAVIEKLALAFEQGTIKILSNKVQLAELQAYESDRTVTGLMRYSAPPGGHDDTVMALALAYMGCSAPSQRVKVRNFRWEDNS
jgi:hypothetical protein